MSARSAHPWPDLDVALCHDWLTGMRGGERVLEILCNAFPHAPVYTLLHNPAAISESINRHTIHTSWLQHLPGIHRTYRNFLPLFPAAINSLKPSRADLLISLSHCVAKALRPPPGTPHLCYCFTPMRYAWLFRDEYIGGNPVKRLASRPLLAWLRRWDRSTAQRVDRFVAISNHVRERILKFYGRDADVVYPPIDLDRWTPDFRQHEGFDLIASALVPYKKIDLAIQVYSRSGYPLRIVGVGSEMARLKAMAGPNVEFTGWKTDADLLALYRGCRMLVFPGEEDFGLVPLEVHACGRPVVAFARGGALETVKDGVSGVFFKEQTVGALSEAVETCAKTAWDMRAIRGHAEKFGIQPFVSGLASSIRQTIG